MKMTSEEVLQFLTNATGGVTFDRCGLDRNKNFLKESENLFVVSTDEIERYSLNMLAWCPCVKSAVFMVALSGHVTVAVRFGVNDFDVFDLDEGWHYWNMASIADEFSLEAYGLLNEVSPGEWKTVTE